MTQQPQWMDRHGDRWIYDPSDNLLHSPETRAFTLDHIQKKWGPLIPIPAIPADAPTPTERVTVSPNRRLPHVFQEHIGRGESNRICWCPLGYSHDILQGGRPDSIYLQDKPVVGGNPRGPEEAQHEFYLVPASMNLRYPPQYAEVCLNSEQDALWAQYALKRRGVKYKIYDRNGAQVPHWKQPDDERKDDHA